MRGVLGRKKKRLYLLTVYFFPFCLSVFLHHTLYIICTYMCVYMQACVCIYVHLESEVNTRYSSILMSLPYCPRQGFSLSLESISSDRLSSPNAEKIVTRCHTLLSDLNPDPHAWATRGSQPETSPSLSHCFDYFSKNIESLSCSFFKISFWLFGVS